MCDVWFHGQIVYSNIEHLSNIDEIENHSFIYIFSGIALCIWTLVMERMTGIYVELVFLDGFLNFGQGLFTFAIFGLDAKYVLMPLQKWLRRKWYGQESLVLLDWEDLDEETKRQCQQFLKHHISNCE